MKVLSIGTDRKVFDKNSQVFERVLGYASKMEESHILVFTLKKEGLLKQKINNLYLHPTNSFSQWFYVWDAYWLGKKIILDYGLVNQTVISTQDPFQTGFVGVYLSKKFNLPLQLQIHTDFLSNHFSKSFFNLIRRIIAYFVIPSAQGIRVVSQVIKDSLEKQYNDLRVTIEILPVFVDIEKIINTKPSIDIKIKFPQFKFVILMASRLTREKRIDVALEAFKKVLSRLSYVGLVIAGDGSERISLENLTNKLGLSNNVVFVGWQGDLVSFYKTANLFLLTSEYEGYGMSLIEAGACGCPIITTRVGIALTSFFVDGKNASVCPVNDIECLSQSILELIMDNVKRELFKREMQDSIKSIIITREEYTARYVGLLEKLTQLK